MVHVGNVSTMIKIVYFKCFSFNIIHEEMIRSKHLKIPGSADI